MYVTHVRIYIAFNPAASMMAKGIRSCVLSETGYVMVIVVIFSFFSFIDIIVAVLNVYLVVSRLVSGQKVTRDTLIRKDGRHRSVTAFQGDKRYFRSPAHTPYCVLWILDLCCAFSLEEGFLVNAVDLDL